MFRKQLTRFAALALAMGMAATPVGAAETDQPAEESTVVYKQEAESLPEETSVSIGEGQEETLHEGVSEKTSEEAVKQKKVTEPAGTDKVAAQPVPAEEEIAIEIEMEQEEASADPASVAIGVYEKDGKHYYRGADGNNMTGWIAAGDGWYYAGPGGILKTGLQTIKKEQYYLDPGTCLMMTGAVQVSGKWYFFDTKSGAKKTNGGWCTDKAGNKFYADGKGILKSGWQKISKKQYYFDPATRAMVTGAVKISGKWYGFGGNTGIQIKNAWGKDEAGRWFYADKKGILKAGWQTIKKKKYYFQPSDRLAAEGITTISGKAYYFAPKKCDLKTGLIKADDENRYYADKNGVLQNGWRKVNGKRYYFLDDYTMQTGGELEIDGVRCLFGSDGALVSAEADSLSDIPASYSGIVFIGSKPYVIKDGIPVYGWYEEGEDRYYLTAEGEKTTGAVIVEDKLYWFGGNGICDERFTVSAKPFRSLTKRQREIALLAVEAILSDSNAYIYRSKENIDSDIWAAENAITNAFAPYYTGAYDERVSVRGYSSKDGSFSYATTWNAKKLLDAMAQSQKMEKLISDRYKKSGAAKQKSTKDKIRVIENYVCRTMKYRIPKGGSSAYTSIKNGQGACDEYAYYLYFMCKKAGIPVRHISGNAGNKNVNNHAWNEVKIGGKWLCIDPTWDDTGSKSSRSWYLKKSLKNHRKLEVTRQSM